MGLKIKNSFKKAYNGNMSTVDEKDANPDKVPIINVHMEEPDRDPIEVKRIEEERRVERNRVRDMEMMEEMDKRSFQQIISMQNSQLAKLTKIADNTTNILNKIMEKKSESTNGRNSLFMAKSAFKQIPLKTYTTIFEQNGPIKL